MPAFRSRLHFGVQVGGVAILDLRPERQVVVEFDGYGRTRRDASTRSGVRTTWSTPVEGIPIDATSLGGRSAQVRLQLRFEVNW